jgi:hypothetical protein
MDFKATERKGVDWIDLADVSDKWQALVNTVMNSLGPQNARIALAKSY